MSSEKRKTNNASINRHGGLFSAVIRQCIAVFICVAFVLGMKFCGNPRMALWTDSLGCAIRQNTNWNIAADSVLSWFEDKLPDVFEPSDKDTPETNGNAGEITFH